MNFFSTFSISNGKEQKKMFTWDFYYLIIELEYVISAGKARQSLNIQEYFFFVHEIRKSIKSMNFVLCDFGFPVSKSVDVKLIILSVLSSNNILVFFLIIFQFFSVFEILFSNGNKYLYNIDSQTPTDKKLFRFSFIIFQLIPFRFFTFAFPFFFTEFCGFSSFIETRPSAVKLFCYSFLDRFSIFFCRNRGDLTTPLFLRYVLMTKHLRCKIHYLLKTQRNVIIRINKGIVYSIRTIQYISNPVSKNKTHFVYIGVYVNIDLVHTKKKREKKRNEGQERAWRIRKKICNFMNRKSNEQTHKIGRKNKIERMGAVQYNRVFMPYQAPLS